MTLLGRDIAEVEALVTDRYLDSLLAAGETIGLVDAVPGRPRRGLTGGRRSVTALDEAVRLASARLTRDLPRFHPSFRFEERLAVRLAEAAAAMRLPAAAGAEGHATVVPFQPAGLPDGADAFTAFEPFDPLADEPDDERDDIALLANRPLLLGGAVAASAISLAGAAWVAWRRSRVRTPMGRAARAAHALRGRPA
ncbi:MAG: hypothetical protein EPO36_02690 [Chloroflexota bacterium]|nr:MAG: hypothetical protein EPO36_02690 [Chloroflexota bacterium]